MSFLFGGDGDGKGSGGGFLGDLVGAVANEVVDHLQDSVDGSRQTTDDRYVSNQTGYQLETGGSRESGGMDLGDMIGAGVKSLASGGLGTQQESSAGALDDIMGAMSMLDDRENTDNKHSNANGGANGNSGGGLLGGLMGLVRNSVGTDHGDSAGQMVLKHGGKGAAGVDLSSLMGSAFGSVLGGGSAGGAAGLLQGLVSRALSSAGGSAADPGSGSMLGTLVGALAGGLGGQRQSSVRGAGSASGDVIKSAMGHAVNSTPSSGGVAVIGQLVQAAIGWIVNKFFNLRGKYSLKSRRGEAMNPAASVFNMNDRGSGLRPRGSVQDFDSLRQQALDSGELFEDPEFPAVDGSVYFSRSPPRPLEWMRPGEITSDPKFISDEATRFDVQQGELGDCWLLAAVANLTLNHDLLSKVVCDDQSFGDNYAGIFHFRFWQYGRWVDVVVDDRLPTYNGQLVFMHSGDNSEFWTALLEKAYAKLHGSYEALKGGTTCEAMEDFSGGVTEMYELESAPSNFFKILSKAHERKSMMGCSIEPDPNVLEAELENGLVRGHAYSITKVCAVEIETPRVSGKIPMVRVRNPWGNEAEWKGAFSDASPEWQYIPQETRDEIGLTFDGDGEFWMTYKDFSSNFQRVEICNLSPDSLTEEQNEDEQTDGSDCKRWEMSVFEGAWVRGTTAGGCRNNIATFHHNPQYTLHLEDPDEDDDEEKCTIIVALMQKNRRSQRKLGLDSLTIGFAVYHLADEDAGVRPLEARFFRYNASVARSPSFINLREVSCRLQLPPGTYVLVPSTFEPNQDGEFLVRVFSEKTNDMAENDDHVGIGEVDDSVKPEIEEESEYDRMVKEFFHKIAGEDLEIDWCELKQVLDYALKREFEFDGFSKDTARSMIALMDVDNSGKLGLHEFRTLWNHLRVWKAAFRLHDQDGTGSLSSFELRAALNAAGYRVNSHLLNSLMHRYGDREGRIVFDDFMALAAKMKTCLEIFKSRDKESTNQAIFSLEDWMEYHMYS